ncbi:Ig-like domain-containing protein [Actinocorallia lasiicapitis]
MVTAGTVGLGGGAAQALPVGPVISISPGQGASGVRPDQPIVVRASRGLLEEVRVDGVSGTFSADRRMWRSGTLRPGRTYVVTARAGGLGWATVTSRFRTLEVKRQLKIASIVPANGEKVGVGMPIIVTFDQPVEDRPTVARALRIESRQPGAWRWIAVDQVVYRPQKYWAPQQKVTLRAGLAWVRSGPGTYGTANRTSTFTVDRSLVSTIDVRRHRMTVRRNGKTVRKIPISAGSGTTPETTTTSGVHLAMARSDPERMVSPGKRPGDPGYYDLKVAHAVRISASGEYVHSAPWSVAEQGRRNVSHGCVNVSPSDAAWFYRRALRGDVIVIKGTARKLDWRNGWGFWQIPWASWAARNGSGGSE